MKTTENIFSFELNESLHFEEGQEISELIGIELEPSIEIGASDVYVSIRGAFELSGKYLKELENADHVPSINEKESLRNPVDEAEATSNNEVQFAHKIPVDISIPEERVEYSDDIRVEIKSFDYELPLNNLLKIKALVEIHGIQEQTEIENVKKTPLEHIRDIPKSKEKLSDEQVEVEVQNETDDSFSLVALFPNELENKNAEQEADLKTKEIAKPNNENEQTQENQKKKRVTESKSKNENNIIDLPKSQTSNDKHSLDDLEVKDTNDDLELKQSIDDEESIDSLPTNEKIAEEVVKDTVIKEKSKLDVVSKFEQDLINSQIKATKPELVGNERETSVESNLETKTTNELQKSEDTTKGQNLNEEDVASSLPIIEAEENHSVNQAELINQTDDESVLTEEQDLSIEEGTSDDVEDHTEINTASQTRTTTEMGVHSHHEGETETPGLSDLFDDTVEETFTSMRLYIVQEKDTLESIAQRYDIPLTKILQHNRLETDDIGEGQLVYIPYVEENA